MVVPAPVPRQLPAPPPLFSGRSRERARLDRGWAQRGDRVVIATIGGSGGIRKTWLVLRWARDHLADRRAVAVRSDLWRTSHTRARV
ncbi:hypothetical protein SSPO_100690 [Streptomyces antimycoticus]|uniref:Uncharacterized protein n=1 Tax=Streptomyces antimycoticus TaxID=68175 RepID=A0A499VCV4_9ACTN|nr:hypothetical protein SSPO_100690 [Streptomyces antimycoticus]